MEPDSRQGSLAPLIAAAICAVFGGVILAVFAVVGFGGWRQHAPAVASGPALATDKSPAGSDPAGPSHV
jgi:hypothetical protein